MSGAVIPRRHVLTAGLGIGAAILWRGRTGGANHANQQGSPPLSAGGGNPAGIPPESAPLIDHRIRLGAVEEWTIVNLDEADHPFHIHTNPFLVTRINGVGLAEPVWRDTVNVRGRGSVTLRSRFEDFTGRFVLHCHISTTRTSA